MLVAITTEGEIACVAATPKTILAMSGATTNRGKLIAWGVSLDGVTSTDAPAVVRLCRYTSAGTMTGCTEQKFDPADPTPALIGLKNASAEPSGAVGLEVHEIHPQGGSYDAQYPLGREFVVSTSITDLIGIEVTVAVNVNALAYMHFEQV